MGIELFSIFLAKNEIMRTSASGQEEIKFNQINSDNLPGIFKYLDDHCVKNNLKVLDLTTTGNGMQFVLVPKD